MVKATIIGHVESIDTSGNYENSFVVSFVVTDEKMPGKKFVNHVKFLVSSKKTELMDTFKVGDKVKVTFYVTGVKGESKKTGKPYQINKLMVSEIVVLESAKPTESQYSQDDTDDSDIPF